MRIPATELDQWLADWPLTWLLSHKYSSCQQRRWEYHIYRCGCGYKINITHAVDADGDYCKVADSGDIPLDHHDVDENPGNIRFTKRVLNTVDKLIEENKFAKNYSLKRLVGAYKDRAYWKQKSPARSSYRTICIIFVGQSSNILMKSLHWRKSFVIIYLWMMKENLLRNHLCTTLTLMKMTGWF